MPTTRLSTASDGSQANDFSQTPRYVTNDSVVFVSRASNLVDGDTNDANDIFLKTLSTGTVTRLSLSGTSNQIGGGISALGALQGNTLVFSTNASLSSGDTNGGLDVYAKDLSTGAVRLVSSTPNGTSLGASSGSIGSSVSPGAVLSPDGTKVVFTNSTSLRASNVFVKDLASGALTRVSEAADGTAANNVSGSGVFSPDGSKVLFLSLASNLVAGDTNNTYDLFVKDLGSGAVARVSTASDGSQGNGLSSDGVFSPDGTRIAFTSAATNLVPGDTNGADDVFVKDLATGAVTRVSTAADGTQAAQDSEAARFSPDGRSVVFDSVSSNLVPGDTADGSDVFVKDLATGAVRKISVPATGGSSDGQSTDGSFSPDGTRVIFDSGSALVAGDTNNAIDIYAADVVCYVSGTRIRTAAGDVVVENLRIGDRVVTASGLHRPIRWLGRRSYGGRFASRNPNVLPVCIRAGALADNVPARDLWVSPKHAVFLDGVLVPAACLLNGVTVIKASHVDRVDYHHVELDSHDVLLAENAPAESFVDDGGRNIFHNARDYAVLYPGATSGDATYCAPRIEDGHALEVIRRRIDARAGLRCSADAPPTCRSDASRHVLPRIRSTR